MLSSGSPWSAALSADSDRGLPEVVAISGTLSSEASSYPSATRASMLNSALSRRSSERYGSTSDGKR